MRQESYAPAAFGLAIWLIFGTGMVVGYPDNTTDAWGIAASEAHAYRPALVRVASVRVAPR